MTRQTNFNRDTAAAAPVATGRPVVRGSLAVGGTITVANGAWFKEPTSYTYQWRRNGINIAGATSASYVITNADKNKSLDCLVIGSNAEGSGQIVSDVAYAYNDETLATLAINSNNWSTGATAGATLATVANRFPGSRIEISPNDGRAIVSDDGTNAVIIRGLSNATIGQQRYRLTETFGSSKNPVKVTEFDVVWTDPSVIAKHAFGQRMVLPTQRFQSVTNITHHAANMVEISPPWDTWCPQYAFAGWYNNEINVGNDVNYEGAWIGVNGVNYDLLVNGQQAFIVPDGGFVVTDENMIRIPANSVVRKGYANNAPVGSYRPMGGPINLPIATYSTTQGYGDAIFNGGSSQLAAAKANTTGSGSATPGSGNWYGAPVAATAKPDGIAAIAAARSVTLVGDSVGWGANGNGFAYGINAAEYGAQGYIMRGLADPANGRIPVINFCVPGTRYPDLGPGPTGEATVNGFAKRAAILAALGFPSSTIICEMGINTVANETGTAQQIADNTRAKALAAWQYLKTLGNRKLIQTTMTAQTLSVNDGGSTNYWRWTSADESKQTRGADGAHVALDNYIMSKPAPLDDVIDIRPYIESSPGSRKIKVPPNQIGTTTAAITAADTTFQMTGWLPKPGDAIVIEPLEATSNYDTPIIIAVTGNATACTVTVRSGQMTKSHASGIEVRGANSNDGTHYTTQGEQTCKYGIIDNKAKIA